MGNLATAYVQVIPSAKGMKENLSGIFSSEMPSAGKSAGSQFGANLVKTVKTALAAAGIGEALRKTITEGAALEQSLGGVETLFKQNAATVIANAQQAYKTAGLSANSYMEQVTSFSASLLKSLGGDTAKAASVADMALIDMSDNANKFGTDMERITDAYQGFAKQNYTMLDNLKLGYGGTKTEMQRLLKDAQALTGVKYDINNLSDVYNAIHAIQENLDITGTTAKEASSTISGSLSSMKAAFSNVLGNLALGEAMGPSLNALAQTTVTFLKGNLVPAITNIVKALPGALVTMVKALIPGGMQDLASTAVIKLSAFIRGKLPSLLENGIEMVTSLTTGFLNGLPGFLDTASGMMNMLFSSIAAILPTVLSCGVQLITQLVTGFLSGLPGFLESAGSILQQLLTTILAALPSMLSSGASLILNLAGGLLSSLPSIASSATTITANLLSTFASHLPDLLAQGISLIGQLVAGLISMIPDVISTAGDIITGIFNAFGETDWLSIGSDIVSGIVSGVWNAAGSLWEAMKDLANQALQKAKDALGIKSPSRVFRREVGIQIPAGAALGVDDGIPLVKRAMSRLNDAVTDSFTANLRIGTRYQQPTSGGDKESKNVKKIEITQYINSKAQTAAELMWEARYQAEMAVLLGV